MKSKRARFTNNVLAPPFLPIPDHPLTPLTRSPVSKSHSGSTPSSRSVQSPSIYWEPSPRPDLPAGSPGETRALVHDYDFAYGPIIPPLARLRRHLAGACRPARHEPWGDWGGGGPRRRPPPSSSPPRGPLRHARHECGVPPSPSSGQQAQPIQAAAADGAGGDKNAVHAVSLRGQRVDSLLDCFSSRGGGSQRVVSPPPRPTVRWFAGSPRRRPSPGHPSWHHRTGRHRGGVAGTGGGVT